MRGEIVQLASSVPTIKLDMRPRLEEIIAILHAIEAGELLSAIPDCEIAQAQHKTATTLLAMAERELIRLYNEMPD